GDSGAAGNYAKGLWTAGRGNSTPRKQRRDEIGCGRGPGVADAGVSGKSFAGVHGIVGTALDGQGEAIGNELNKRWQHNDIIGAADGVGAERAADGQRNAICADRIVGENEIRSGGIGCETIAKVPVAIS